MRRRDLCNDLRKEFQEDRLCGGSKAHDPKYRNIWAVVPATTHCISAQIALRRDDQG